MKNMLVLAAPVLLLAAVAATPAKAADAKAGQAKTAACAACHGADGNSAAPSFPKLAGQSEAYIVKQLNDFKTGAESMGKNAGRYDPAMTPMAMTVADADVADIGAWFAAQQSTFATVKNEHLSAGRKLYNGGDASRGIPACTACHGPDGTGMKAAGFPRLGGQHVDYTIKQLNAFRKGERKNDNNGVMQDIAKKMSEEQVTALANYLAGLH